MTIRVLIVDDHRIFREGLRALLAREPNIEVLKEAQDGRTAVKLCKKLHPDVVIMDVTMPGLSGIEATRKIVAADPETRVVALSMHSDRRFVAGMLDAGASGYLLKDTAFEELARCIRTVNARQFYLSPGITGIVVREYKSRLDTSKIFGGANLTPRECEVLQLLAEGKKTIGIASMLMVSAKTVESHRKNIMDKLDLHSIAELTKYAVREGLTGLGH